jgi:hypothetical protein
MQVKFLLKDEPCVVFGKEFPFGVSVDVSDLAPQFQAKLKANPTFEVVEEVAKASTKKEA